jgi:hypothetical protein
VKGVQQAARRLLSRMGAFYNDAADALSPLLQARMFQIRAEGEDLLRLRAAQIERRRNESGGSQENLRSGLIAGAERREAFARQLIEARLGCITRARDRLRESKPTSRTLRTVMIRPVPDPSFNPPLTPGLRG